MDKIFINGMTVPVIIGTLPHERENKQEITLDLVLECDMKKAGRSDDLMDAVDYSAVENSVFRSVSASSFFLLEALAEQTADCCLEFPGVTAVTVKIDKPAAAAYSKSIAIEIRREK